MIWELFKDQTEYNLLKPKFTIMRLVKTCIDELVEEKIDSGIKIKQNDFKRRVKQFTIWVNKVQIEVDLAIKDKQT